MLRFRRMRSLQKFAAVHASVSNHFNQERSRSRKPSSRPTAPPLLPSGAVLAQHKVQRYCTCRDEFKFV